jgi:hypothetical protein
MRGLWRWWETKNGADVWWARVETAPGAWADYELDRYEAEACQPRFWDLPLRDDYMKVAMRDQWDRHVMRMEPRAGRYATLVFVLIAAVAAVLAIAGFALFARLGF